MPESTTDKTGGNSNTDISALRRMIDEIDDAVLDLINRRLELAQQIGGAKKIGGIQITDSRRENEIMDRLIKTNNGPLKASGLRSIFAAIIAEGRSVQKKQIEGLND
jgi:chorismate mutase/prephenate dehydratase